MSDATLGQLPDENAQRDAIHVAIAPVMAAESLNAGTHVGLNTSGQADTEATPHIGVVDPFLKQRVKAGQTFWLCLYQKTVTGMRHHWSHPAFENKPSVQVNPSEAWLRNFADSAGANYEEMMRIAATHCDHEWGDYLIDGSRWEGQETPKEFWEHFTNVTGKKPDTKYGLPGIFSCSC